jgi:bifunctional DNA-binding transcriptional regulator/antitoxin component of YhaV-PrlF toxin-antitoxin module
MKVQFNKQTKMTWSYIPTSVAKKLEINKGDEIEFKEVEKKDPSEFIVKKK